MNITFTLCSKNYLAQAKTLADSFRDHNPDTKFIIGIVDLLDKNQIEQLSDYNILLLRDVKISELDIMFNRYTIVELCTAVKPFYFHYFFKELEAGKVIYLDPDIYVYNSLESIYQKLDHYSFILSPHITKSINDNEKLNEHTFLVSGIFNLGFLAVQNNQIGNDLIDWWSRRLRNECIMDQSKGYFVDQKWMNLSVCLFENYLIDKDLGINVAHWNLHERFVSRDKTGVYLINEKYPLLFFHFSSYNPEFPQKIANWQTRFDFDNRNDIFLLFDTYRSSLYKSGYTYFSKLIPSLGIPFNTSVFLMFRIKLRIFLFKLINKILQL